MNVREIVTGDYARLESAGGFLQLYCRNVRRWIDEGAVSPADCYIFEVGGAPVGGVCFCSYSEHECEILDFALIDARAAYGAKSLKDAVRIAANADTKTIGYNLYDDTGQYADLLRLFAHAGFRVAQEKKCYVYEKSDPPQRIGTLLYRSVEQAGENVFTNAVKEVTVGTLDSSMSDDAARLGGDIAAREYVDYMKKIDFNPDWWQLGYLGDQLVGLILPQRFDAKRGGINYVGVVPEHRGNGYGAALLAEGTRILCENSVKIIYADIDARNHPLEAVLKQVGYIFRMNESVLRLTLKNQDTLS